MNPLAITELDDLVVGGGITGSLMAFALHQKGRVAGLMDSGKEISSSAVAAGIINPVTGKNFVKSWHIDTFLPVAVNLYRQIEKKLGVRILEKMNIIRQLAGPGAENQWASRLLDETYHVYTAGTTDLSAWEEELVLRGSYAEIQNAYRADLWTCISAVSIFLQEKSLYWNQAFDHSLLKRAGEVWTYPGLIIKNVIFCEGYKGAHNPFFSTQAFALTEGKASLLSVPGSKINKMVKDEIFLVPLGNDTFWVGGGYSPWKPGENPAKELPTETPSYSHWILKPHQHLAEISAVRPTTKSRRPIILKHDSFPAMYFVNGMGTKGSSMAPYFVSLLADILNGDKPADELVLPK